MAQAGLPGSATVRVGGRLPGQGHGHEGEGMDASNGSTTAAEDGSSRLDEGIFF